ncbi:MAG TPA: hypothetical protein VGN72_23275 [Tepidisphaeraceae bacterium]|jgi:hypothetical protein|nr:hypothetical protein [Tepidisphaeraceae bacterium]
MSSFWIALVLLVTASPNAWAEPSISVVNRFGSPEYVPGAWVPLRVTLTNDTNRAIDGRVEARVPGVDGPLLLSAAIPVPANARIYTVMYAPLGENPDRPRAGQGGKPLAIFEWLEGGGKLAQTDLLLKSAADGEGGEGGAATMLGIQGGEGDDRDPYDAFALRKPASETLGVPVALVSISTDNLSPHPVAYDGYRAIHLLDVAVAEATPAEQAALLSYVRSGGTLGIYAPLGQSDVRGTWLEPLMPVRTIGHRLAGRIQTTAGPVELREPVEITEAVAADGATVLLADKHYVHAAYRQLGLGRIVFTSFPVNAPKWDEERMRDFWTELLGLSRPQISWDASRLPAQSPDILGEMIGTPAPPRTIAVALAAGFAVVVVALQLVWRGARRPWAFAATSVVALGVAAALVGMGLLSQKQVPLTAGRVSVMNLADRGGLIQEMAAFTGDVADLTLTTRLPGATLQPFAYDGSDAPTLLADTFTVPGAGAAARRIDRVWQASASTPPGIGATATGQFGEEGLRLSVDNELGAALQAPVLTSGGSVYRLSPLEQGKSETPVAPDARNTGGAVASDSSGSSAQSSPDQVAARAQKYLNAGPILTDTDKLRALVLSSVLTPAQSLGAAPPSGGTRLQIGGWVEGGELPSIIDPSVTPQLDRSLRLALFPVNLRPSEPGTTVKVDAGFNTPVTGKTAIAVLDVTTGTWLPSSQPGLWQIGFRPPREIGQLTPTRATLRANVSLPVQSMIVRRGQVRDGELVESAMSTGEVVARWDRTFGQREPVTFDLTPADFDETGTVWLSLEIEAPPLSAGVVPLWNINDLGLDIEGRVNAAAPSGD